MTSRMKIFTIGFTQTSAKDFFGRLASAGVKSLTDVRLNNESQLAGFTKRNDLAFFCDAVARIEYQHLPALAPTKEILDPYKKGKTTWGLYEGAFRSLMCERKIENTPRDLLDGTCLLCSEKTPHHCHRRLVAEYLREHWGDVDIVHL